MSADRWIWWQEGLPRPTWDDLVTVTKDFFDGALKEIRWSKSRDRFYAVLVGNWSHPLLRVAERETPELAEKFDAQVPRDMPGWEERMVEVWLGDRCCDVMTRSADAFTSGCATRLGEEIARFWKGKYEEG